METQTEKIRTLRIPIIAREFHEVNIALPYYCKTEEYGTKVFIKITEALAIKLSEYANPYLAVYTVDSAYAPKDEEIARYDISTEEEFEAAMSGYVRFIKTLRS